MALSLDVDHLGVIRAWQKSHADRRAQYAASAGADSGVTAVRASWPGSDFRLSCVRPRGSPSRAVGGSARLQISFLSFVYAARSCCIREA